MRWLSSRRSVDHLDPAGRRQLHAQVLSSDSFDSGGHGPSRLLDLKLAVFDIVSTGLGLFALELNEELPGLMARGDERQGTSDKNGQQNEIDAQHHASGPSVRSATRMMALRARGFAAFSAAPGRRVLPMS